MKNLLILICTILTVSAFSQKKVLIEDPEKVMAEAIAEIEEAMKAPEGEIYLFVQENNIKGSYDFDITLREKGEVASVFVRGNEGGTIKMQNSFKDFIKELKFNFKMPKGKSYKFNYVFKLN
jgi:hypothetical protein